MFSKKRIRKQPADLQAASSSSNPPVSTGSSSAASTKNKKTKDETPEASDDTDSAPPKRDSKKQKVSEEKKEKEKEKEKETLESDKGKRQAQNDQEHTSTANKNRPIQDNDEELVDDSNDTDLAKNILGIDIDETRDRAARMWSRIGNFEFTTERDEKQIKAAILGSVTEWIDGQLQKINEDADVDPFYKQIIDNILEKLPDRFKLKFAILTFQWYRLLTRLSSDKKQLLKTGEWFSPSCAPIMLKTVPIPEGRLPNDQYFCCVFAIMCKLNPKLMLALSKAQRKKQKFVDFRTVIKGMVAHRDENDKLVRDLFGQLHGDGTGGVYGVLLADKNGIIWWYIGHALRLADRCPTHLRLSGTVNHLFQELKDNGLFVSPEAVCLLEFPPNTPKPVLYMAEFLCFTIFGTVGPDQVYGANTLKTLNCRLMDCVRERGVRKTLSFEEFTLIYETVRLWAEKRIAAGFTADLPGMKGWLWVHLAGLTDGIRPSVLWSIFYYGKYQQVRKALGELPKGCVVQQTGERSGAIMLRQEPKVNTITTGIMPYRKQQAFLHETGQKTEFNCIDRV
ncbi:hypothetical protein C8J56DRAFT_884604 [Mycena floridula]|nr:hypothetical protein C8J56DRAFT_884604 [Mycena floridula]